MKMRKRLVAALLSVVLLVGMSGITSFATEATNVEVTDTEVTSTEATDTEEVTDVAVTEDQDDQVIVDTDDIVEDYEIQLHHIVIIESVIHLPDTQYAMVSLEDEELVVESATLRYIAPDSDEIREMEASNLVANTMLFTWEFDVDAVTGIYELKEIEYIVQGEEEEDAQIISLEQEEMEASFVVTDMPRPEPVEELEDLFEVTAIVFDEDENAIEISGNDIAETVEEALELAEEIAEAEGQANPLLGEIGIEPHRGDLVVAIDPGHDDRHPGAPAHLAGQNEAALNLRVARYMEAELARYEGVRTVMTRTSSACPHPSTTSNQACIRARVNRAADQGAHVFISLHFNAGGGTGAEIIIQNNSVNPAVGQQSRQLAERIMQELQALGLHNRRIFHVDFPGDQPLRDAQGRRLDAHFVNRYSKARGITSMIVEHAFLDNAADAARIRNEPQFIRQLGVANARGIASMYDLRLRSQNQTPPPPPATRPTAQRVRIINDRPGSGTFTVSVEGINAPGGIQRVQIPVWPTATNQRDIRWYTATRQPNGSFTANVTVANHGFRTGAYRADVWVTDNAGRRSFVGGVNHTVQRLNVNVTAQDRAGTQTNYALRATNVGLFGNVRRVQFAVWNAPNQSDLRWYNATRDNQGAWNATAVVANHRRVGTYRVDAWVTLANGSQRFMGGTTFNVDRPTANVTIANVNSSRGTFDVLISGINSRSGVREIQVPVWSRTNQGDIVWYRAVRQSNGVFRAQVEASRHRNHTGNFTADVWLTAGNGVRVFVGGRTQVVNAPPLTRIMGNSQTTVAQMVRYFNAARRPYPATALGRGGAPNIETFARMFLEEANREGVRAEVAFTQAMHETGFLQFGNIVQVHQFNFGGIGALDHHGPGQANSFRDVRTGIRAQIHHLRVYAHSMTMNHPSNTNHPVLGSNPPRTVRNGTESPRAHLVHRPGMAPYVNWLGVGENPNFPQNGWATNPNYGRIIANMVRELLRS